ncbi:hypothetical protein Pmani_035057 [Petrolisthes manimaculis]|uniref:Uncharacterized protein n=1 Tax=Petrolisthes manimaculis TaxID=1843537 RepID=A0AAE1NMP9_9EUCA|nr:hypothetical protein Pmani_035057 [Petrolisthes manimaculis]
MGWDGGSGKEKGWDGMEEVERRRDGMGWDGGSGGNRLTLNDVTSARNESVASHLPGKERYASLNYLTPLWNLSKGY